MHKVILYLFLFGSVISCAPQSSKKEQALKRDLTKATAIIAKKNHLRLQKLKLYAEKDTANEALMDLYQSFVAIHTYKEAYILAVNSGQDIVKASEQFIVDCFNELTKEQQQVVNESLKDSPIADADFLEENKGEDSIKLELQLEAEILVQELDQLLVKDLKTNNRTFDWEIFWE